MIRIIYALFAFYCFLLFGCKTGNYNHELDKDTINLDDLKGNIVKSTKTIFYNMFLPCEMSYIFEKTGVKYNPLLINSKENLEHYTTTNKKAINLGIYGVDLGYLRLNDQNQEIKEYSVIISKISNEMGIPTEYVTDAMDYLKQDNSNADSLYQMTCELFEITDSYLNKNERQNISALVILGGWVEALYIATNINGDQISKEMMLRIAKQKYSLNSLISLLTIYQDNYVITNYLIMLNSLQKVYDEIDIYYKDSNVSTIDTSKKIISTDNAEIIITPDQYTRISDIIEKIRNHMIE